MISALSKISIKSLYAVEMKVFVVSLIQSQADICSFFAPVSQGNDYLTLPVIMQEKMKVFSSLGSQEAAVT